MTSAANLSWPHVATVVVADDEPRWLAAAARRRHCWKAVVPFRQKLVQAIKAYLKNDVLDRPSIWPAAKAKSCWQRVAAAAAQLRKLHYTNNQSIETKFHNIKRKLGFNTSALKAILWCVRSWRGRDPIVCYHLFRSLASYRRPLT